jgi:ADP-heptose:LPS heptosyltransferase
MYTDRVSRPRELRPRHSVTNQSDLLAPLGIPPLDPAIDPVEMCEAADARRRVDALLAAARVPTDAELIVVHVSAGNPFRRWPSEAFVRLAAALARGSSRRRIVLTSGPSEIGAAEEIARRARAALDPQAAGRILMTEELGLAALRVVVARAALFVGGDSGPLHVAGTTKTPIVAIYGPTLPARSQPWRDPDVVSEAVEPPALPCRPCDQRTCVPGDFRCLAQITAEQVTSAAERALARAREARRDRADGPHAAAAGGRP